MQITRRHMLQTGFAAGGLALVSQMPPFAAASAWSSNTSPPLDPPIPDPAIPQATVLVDPVIDPRLLARARRAFSENRHLLRHTDVVGITDFSRPSREARFYLLDTATGQVSRHFVSHGRGSDPAHSGWLQRFSNAPGSNATSDGAYLTGEYYIGKYGRSMRLAGLEARNNNAERRAIVVHSAWYAEPEVIRQHGKLGRSEGCFAFSSESLREVLDRLGPGRLLYADKV